MICNPRHARCLAARAGLDSIAMLAERLEEFFQREERARVRDYFYVTEVSKCPRQIYYAVKGFPKPPLDGLTVRKLAVG
ncbi:hypothetical protein H5T53_02300, partial [Candidatus Bipolaricaulota bacterium]|nr:hypothetical protein [Candidatus Bipolaricaulota bacterium]